MRKVDFDPPTDDPRRLYEDLHSTAKHLFVGNLGDGPVSHWVSFDTDDGYCVHLAINSEDEHLDAVSFLTVMTEAYRSDGPDKDVEPATLSRVEAWTPTPQGDAYIWIQITPEHGAVAGFFLDENVCFELNL